MKPFNLLLSLTLLSVPVTTLAEGGGGRVIARMQARRDESMARFLEREDAKAIVNAQEAAKTLSRAQASNSGHIERSVDQP